VQFAIHGGDALEKMRVSVPDVVLTDLQMPEVDGLHLVEAIRSSYPYVPTILMTAHGSEETALDALNKGAANYVAKKNLAKRLAETVRDVVSISGGGRNQQRLASCWSQSQFEFNLENDASLIPPLIKHLQQYSASIRPSDETELLRIGVALHEAIRNAMHHGNLELQSEMRNTSMDEYYKLADQRRTLDPYKSRRVTFTATESPEESRYLIRDQGVGFDVKNFDYNPDDPMHMARPSGRGLFLMRTFMTEVKYNEAGNEVLLVHRRAGV
jgi:CheY-like chemotaxis protein